jgi:hypothetical protein
MGCVNRNKVAAPVLRQKRPQVVVSEIAVKIRNELTGDTLVACHATSDFAIESGQSRVSVSLPPCRDISLLQVTHASENPVRAGRAGTATNVSSRFLFIGEQ